MALRQNLMAQVVQTRRPQFLQWCFFRCRTARKVDWHSEHLLPYMQCDASPNPADQPNKRDSGVGGCDSRQESASFCPEEGVVFFVVFSHTLPFQPNSSFTLHPSPSYRRLPTHRQDTRVGNPPWLTWNLARARARRGARTPPPLDLPRTSSGTSRTPSGQQLGPAGQTSSPAFAGGGRIGRAGQG